VAHRAQVGLVEVGPQRVAHLQAQVGLVEVVHREQAGLVRVGQVGLVGVVHQAQAVLVGRLEVSPMLAQMESPVCSTLQWVLLSTTLMVTYMLRTVATMQCFA